MKMLAILFAIGVINGHFETRPFSGDLGAQIRGTGPAWFGYEVKSVGGEHDYNCGDSHHSSNPVQLEGPKSIAVLFRVSNNAIEKIRIHSLECQLDAGGLQFVWIENVPASASLAFLEKQASNFEGAVAAIAQHSDPQADAVLDRLARSGAGEKTREQAIFWLGASRGAHGLTTLRDLLAHDPSEKIRDKAVFALSVSKQPEALGYLIQSAKSDPSAHVRAQAIFWLAQKAGKQAMSAINDAIENDVDTGVKKKAVFALSQLPKDEGVPKLIEVARNQKNSEVRKQAMFWLGQSGDPRALAFIEQVLSK
jgi:HEAT repeat protein